MKTALITLSATGARLLAPLVGRLAEARLYVHEAVPPEALEALPPEPLPSEPSGLAAPAPKAKQPNAKPGKRGSHTKATAIERFTKIADLTAALFPVCQGLVYAAPCGVVVRALAPLLRSKLTDPAVVCLDAGGRWAVSLLSGHEGGANDLTIRVANLVGAEPIVTTTTEALKSVICGIGCRRGTKAEAICAAIRQALAETGISPEEVRLIASADLKSNEPGLLAAAERLGIPLRFLTATEIQNSPRDFGHSDFVQEKVNLPAVAEPAALLAGRRTQLILGKKSYGGITIALAREALP